MRKMLAGVAATAVALALAGCAPRTTEGGAGEPIAPDPWTASDALGATGMVLLIPAIALWVLSAVDYNVTPYTFRDGPSARGKRLMYGGFGVLGVAAVLWVIAVWTAVSG